MLAQAQASQWQSPFDVVVVVVVVAATVACAVVAEGDIVFSQKDSSYCSQVKVQFCLVAQR